MPCENCIILILLYFSDRERWRVYDAVYFSPGGFDTNGQGCLSYIYIYTIPNRPLEVGKISNITTSFIHQDDATFWLLVEPLEVGYITGKKKD